MNAAFESISKAKTKPYVDPIVTVALKSDGSVESVIFNRSSGVPEIDAAVTAIVQKLSPFAAFPPDVAREYDIVEIRRLWTLDVAIRLFAGHP
jgi:TonB family protein